MRRLEPAVELLAHNVAVGAGCRIIGQVRPAFGIGECINANADSNADHHPKQDPLNRAKFHLCIRSSTIDPKHRSHDFFIA